MFVESESIGVLLLYVLYFGLTNYNFRVSESLLLCAQSLQKGLQNFGCLLNVAFSKLKPGNVLLCEYYFITIVRHSHYFSNL